MQIAQKLYEGVDIDGETVGLITYMRTDGVQLPPRPSAAARKVIESEFGQRYVPKAPANTRSRPRTRRKPTRPSDRPICSAGRKDVASSLDRRPARLYDLIWKRAIASQMESADSRTQATVEMWRPDGAARLRATGQVIRFDGFLKLYQEGRDDEEDDEESGRLPPMADGDPLTGTSQPRQHLTEPPPRYTEASLVKRMEELGIGRPSTYASTLGVLRDRDYVRLEKKRLLSRGQGPSRHSVSGKLLHAVMSNMISPPNSKRSSICVSNHEIDWKQVLRDFWADFSTRSRRPRICARRRFSMRSNELLGPHIFPAKEDGSNPRACPSCGTGQLSLKLGKFGAFIGCSNYPECRFTRTLADTNAESIGDSDRPGVKVLGQDPETGDEITLRDGRFGTYVQQGEGEKPKRSSLPKNIAPADVTLERRSRS